MTNATTLFASMQALPQLNLIKIEKRGPLRFHAQKHQVL